MSETAAVPPASNKKKRFLVAGVLVAIVLSISAAGAFFFFKSRLHDEEDDDAQLTTPSVERKSGAREAKMPPVFLQLDPFTFNLADRDAEHMAQLTLTLEIADSQVAEQIKQFMPLIRSDILLLLCRKHAHELRTEEGKVLLAAELLVTASGALGHKLPIQAVLRRADSDQSNMGKDMKLPIKAVHFVNFIVQ